MSFTITTNKDGSLTFGGAGGETGSEYSVSFTIVATKDEGESSTYTVTMSNFEISGSLSSAFGESGSSVTASAIGITYIKVSAGIRKDQYIAYLPIEKTGLGNGTNPQDISSYLYILDQLQSLAEYVTVTMTCTSEAKLSISVDNAEFVTCAFAVDEGGTLSFSADGLENIFDTLTVKGEEIVKIEAGGKDVTNDVIAGTTTSISSIQTKDTVEVARYNLMGQKISGSEKGINIIVYSDGSAKKVLVK